MGLVNLSHNIVRMELGFEHSRMTLESKLLHTHTHTPQPMNVDPRQNVLEYVRVKL